MRATLYQVDAFADRPFEGNPAAVVPLETWLPDAVMQALAAENNLAETAFFVPEGEAYRLRWFTPTTEVRLCGHATLATAHVIFTQLGYSAPEIAFETLSGRLTVTRDGDKLAMNFPAEKPKPMPEPEGLSDALGAKPRAYARTANVLAVFDTPQEVAGLKPNFPQLAKILTPFNAVLIASARTPEDGEFDFVSRVFAAAHGINEDPVTGSSYCTSAPYWARVLGKDDLVARQISARGGTVWCSHRGDRVVIQGRCADYLKGEFEIPDHLLSDEPGR